MTSDFIDVRRIAAVLANRDMRLVYAEIVISRPVEEIAIALNPAKRKRVMAALIGSGLVDDAGDSLHAADTVFRTILAQQPPAPVASGLDRFIRDGRINRYPANLSERRKVLEWVARQCLVAGEALDEHQVNDRLLAFTDDFALLRRYLVDYGLLARTQSGSRYILAPDNEYPDNEYPDNDEGPRRGRGPS